MDKATPWRLCYGAKPLGDQGVRFRVWAPDVSSLSLQRADAPALPMTRNGEDFVLEVSEAKPGDAYSFLFEDGRQRPDPVSRSQPYGVHGPSQIIDPDAFVWSDQDWKGLALADYILYELHIGTFTPEGTFTSAISKLGHLKDLGITAIELMPVGEFPGTRNWGYDQVDLYAPHSAYGGPDGLKAFVNECHQAGLAVVLDVVYNHVGPEGNYLAEFGPYYTDHYRTPWGRAINYDGAYSDAVRRFFIDNALYWLTEYHIDALRLDAIHGIFDLSARHVLAEIRDRFHEQAAHLGREAWIIAESDLNDVRVLNPHSAGGLALDVGRLQADTGAGPVPLTRLEFLLLRELMEYPGRSVPKGQLLASVWGLEFDPGSNVVDVCVRRLRSKLGFELIKTVRGEGYQLAAFLCTAGVAARSGCTAPRARAVGSTSCFPRSQRSRRQRHPGGGHGRCAE